jgi:hypothetical protein
MSGRHLVQFALAEANDASNGHAGYTVNLWLRSGRQLHGAVVGKLVYSGSSALIKLRLWERPLHNGYPRDGEPPVPTDREVLIDADEVEQIEIDW